MIITLIVSFVGAVFCLYQADVLLKQYNIPNKERWKICLWFFAACAFSTLT